MADLIPLSAVQAPVPQGAPASPSVQDPGSDWQPDATRQTGTRESGFTDERAPFPGAFGYTNTKTGEWSSTPPAAPPSSPALIPLDQVQTPAPPTPAAQQPETSYQFTSLGPLSGPSNALHGFTDQMERALTLGLSDKAAAVVPTLNRAVGMGYDWLTGQPDNGASLSDTYHAALNNERAAGDAYAANHPVASKIATTAGTVASIPMMAGEAAPAAATLIGRVGQGLKLGGTVGAVGGFGGSNDESLAKTATDTAEGAGFGGVLGAASPVAAEHVIAPLYNWVARRFSPAAVESQAVKRIVQRIGQDTEGGGPSAQDMLDLVNAAGNKPITLADLGGNNVLGEAGRVARAPGPGKQAAIDVLNARDAGAGTRLAQDINQGISNGGSAYETTNALMKARDAAAQPAYAKAFANDAYSPRIQQFLDTPEVKAGLNKGIQLERLDALAEGRQFDPLSYGVDLDADGNWITKGTPNMRVLDAGKRGLDAMIANERNDVTGKLTPLGRSLSKVKDAYVGELDRLNPDYAAARALFSGPSQSMNAVRLGQTFQSRSPEEIAAEFGQLSPSDQEFYKLGAADTLKTNLARTGMAGDEAKKIIGNEQIQKQLRPLFSDQASYDRFINAARTENRMFDTRLQTVGNSATAGRVAEDDAARSHGGALSGALEAGAGLMMGEHVAPLAGGMRILRSLSSNRPPQDPGVNAAIARMLFNTDPAANRQVLARIIARQNTPTALPLATVPLASLGARAAVPLLRGN